MQSVNIAVNQLIPSQQDNDLLKKGSAKGGGGGKSQFADQF